MHISGIIDSFILRTWFSTADLRLVAALMQCACDKLNKMLLILLSGSVVKESCVTGTGLCMLCNQMFAFFELLPHLQPLAANMSAYV